MTIKISTLLIIFTIYNLFILKSKMYITFYGFIIMHELSHTIIALLLNFDIAEIVLTTFGVNAKIDYSDSKIKELIIALIGPTMSLIFAIAFKNRFYYMVNLIITIFNLLPVYPLDGGRILRCVISLLFNEKVARVFSRILSTAFLIIFWGMGFFMIFKFNTYYMLFLAIALSNIYIKEVKKERMQMMTKYLQILK